MLQHFGYWYVPLFMIIAIMFLINNQKTEVQNYKEQEVHDLSLLTSDFYITLFNLLLLVSTRVSLSFNKFILFFYY